MEFSFLCKSPNDPRRQCTNGNINIECFFLTHVRRVPCTVRINLYTILPFFSLFLFFFCYHFICVDYYMFTQLDEKPFVHIFTWIIWFVQFLGELTSALCCWMKGIKNEKKSPWIFNKINDLNFRSEQKKKMATIFDTRKKAGIRLKFKFTAFNWMISAWIRTSDWKSVRLEFFSREISGNWSESSLLVESSQVPS